MVYYLIHCRSSWQRVSHTDCKSISLNLACAGRSVHPHTLSGTGRLTESAHFLSAKLAFFSAVSLVNHFPFFYYFTLLFAFSLLFTAFKERFLSLWCRALGRRNEARQYKLSPAAFAFDRGAACANWKNIRIKFIN